MPRTTFVLQTKEEPTAEQVEDLIEWMSAVTEGRKLTVISVTAVAPGPEKSTTIRYKTPLQPKEFPNV
jgi:hypothetical protein